MFTFLVIRYELNEETSLFNVEYADVLGIPFDFTARPVPAPPKPPHETIHVRAVRPERDYLEICFPRVEGYQHDTDICGKGYGGGSDRTLNDTHSVYDRCKGHTLLHRHMKICQY